MQLNQESLISAILTFNQRVKSNQEEFKQADLFLRQSKKQKEMWQISIDILKQNQNDPVVLFFCAQFLKEKMKFDFYQIQNQDLNSLLKDIIELLNLHQESQNPVKSFLVEVFIIFYMNNFQLFSDLIQFFQQHFVGEQGNKYVLQIVESIPVEAENQSIVIEEKKRQNFIEYLHKNVEQQIFQMFDKIDQITFNKKNQTFLLNGFLQWIKFTENQYIIQNIDKSSIFPFVIESLIDVNLVEYTCEIFEQILKKSTNSNEFQRINQIISQNILNIILICIKNIEDGMMDEAYIMIKLICKFGKKNIYSILKQKEFQFLLQLQNIFCLKDIDYGLMNPIYKFFTQIIDILQREKYFDQEYEQFLLSLLQSSLKKLIFREFYEDPQDQERLDTKDQRKLLGDLFCDVSYYLNFDKTFELIFVQIEQTIQKIQYQQSNQNLLEFESYLFMIDWMLIDIQKDKDEEIKMSEITIQKILELIKFVFRSDIQSIHIRKQILKLIRDFSPFLQKNPDWITSIFQFSVQNITQTKLFKQACKAISKLCTYNKQFVVDNFSDFLNLFEKLKDNEDYLLGITNAIQTIQNQQQYQQYLTQILQPFAQNLAIFYQKPDENNLNLAKNSFQKLVLIIQRVNPAKPQDTDHVLQPIFKELFPIIMFFQEKYYQDEELIEESSRVCKHSMRCLKHLFSPFLIQYMQFITKQFDKNPIGSYLYQAEVIVTAFGQNEQFKNYLQEMLLFLSTRTLEEIQKSKQIEDNPQLIEDFFGMNTRYIRYAKDISIHKSSEQLLQNLFELIYVCIGIQNPSAAKCLYYFIENILDLKENQKIEQLFLKGYGQKFVEKLIQTIVSYPNQEIRTHIFDIFYGLLDKYQNESVEWFQFGIKNLEQDILTFNEKVTFIDDIQQIGKRDKTMKNFSKRCKQSLLRQII